MTVTNGSMEDKMITSMIPSKTKTDEQFFWTASPKVSMRKVFNNLLLYC